MQITYDRYSMMLDGRREFIRSGAMHYFRLPSPDLWRDRLYKLKAAGYNTVDLYFNWGFHSPKPGEYDFSGCRDVRKLLDITKELGLWVIARPGPYINAEVSGGGFPMWLLAKKDLPLRNRRNGAFVWSDEYMRYVREWWEQIIPVINDYDHILMCQIENEYSTQDMEPDTMQALYKLARELGVKVPLSHNDLFFAGLYADIVDLYGFDNYSVTSFDQNWRNIPSVFGVLDNIERSLRPFCKDRPLMVCELQAGWFGGWKGPTYEKIIEHLGREHIAVTTKSLLAQGLTVYNHYKAIGGTNWDYLGRVESYTSYDFGAPISEPGLNTERLYETKTINNFLASFDLVATDRVEEPPCAVQPQEMLYGVRANAEDAKQQWLFLRNLEPETKTVVVNEQFNVTLPSHDFLILPWNITLLCGMVLKCATTEVMYQSERVLVLEGDRPLTALFETTEKLSPENSEQAQWKKTDTGYQLCCTSPAPDAFYKTQLGELVIVVLGNHLRDTLWVHDANTLTLGPDARLGKHQYGINSNRTVHQVDLKTGEITTEKKSAKPAPNLPVLGNWNLMTIDPAHLDIAMLEPVSATGPDFDDNGHYEGCGWYAVPLKKNQKPKTVSILARHIWAVYCNTQFVASGHHIELVYGQEPSGRATFAIPAEAYEDADNVLWIYVDSLGHYKGFHDDQQVAPGLIELLIDNADVVADNTPLLFAGDNHWPEPPGMLSDFPAAGAPLVRVETGFSLPVDTELEFPVGLDVGQPVDTERVNIILNGTLVGRWWCECGSQQKFYLPEGLLKRNGENKLAIELFNANPVLTQSAVSEILANIHLFAYDTLTRVDV